MKPSFASRLIDCAGVGPASVAFSDQLGGYREEAVEPVLARKE